MDKKSILLEADIKVEKETASLRETAASIINLPKDSDKQIDLLYFSAIFVSSGENLNHAYFMPSELVKAEGTIINKALDVEHKEEEIIGHIYERAFMDKEGNPLDLTELSALETASLDNQEIHIAIAGIIYKNRFPNIAEEVANKQWSVSMEAYYRDYDVKVGDLVVSRKEAEALGVASKDGSIIGRIGKVLKNGKEIASGTITRVLRYITFSGCGIVKNPANPPSVILETATEKINKEISEEVVVFDLDKLKSKEKADNNVTSNNIDEENKTINDIEVIAGEENAEINYDDTIGICVNFKRRIFNKKNEIIGEDWCSLYNRGCTSFSRDTSDPDCLRNAIKNFATSCVNDYLADRSKRDKRVQLLNKVYQLLDTRQ